MTEATEFGRVVLIVAVGFAAAIFSSRLSGWLRVPAPALFLAVAAVSSDISPSITPLLSIRDVERICVLALILILFDGGMEIGAKRFRRSLGPIFSLGVAGTFLVAAALAAGIHLLIGFGWSTALLIGAALAPTDPAVTFTVLGGREVAGRSGDILKGESGVNDPVGIALVLGLLQVSTANGSVGGIAVDFAAQMAVGLAVGVAGGLLLARAMRDFALPDSALYPLRTLAAAGVVYGLASVLHGSGFLAVFVAGVLVGDVRAPYRREVVHFHAALASLAEIVVFVALGLTVDLGSLDLLHIWVDGIVIAVMLTFAARPLVVAVFLSRARLEPGEKVFIAWAGLRGAVPILLAAFALLERADHAARVYGIVFVVVMFSVVVQGSLVGRVARATGVPISVTEQEPWPAPAEQRAET